MAYPIPAVAAYLLTEHFKVRRDQKILCTAVAAFVPGPLALAPAFVAASNTRQGHRFGSGLFRRSHPQAEHHQPQHHETYTRVVPAEPITPDTSPPWPTVPSVVGLLRTDAISALQKKGFQVGVLEIPTDEKTDDTVFEQTDANQLVWPGKQINLKVARKPVPAVTPVTEQAAIEAVKKDVDDFRDNTGAALVDLKKDIANLTTAVTKFTGSKPS